MKKTKGFAALILALVAILAFGFSIAEAKPYKALNKEVKTTVEIPDDAVMPAYLDRLERAESEMYLGAPVGVDYYADPEFQYFNDKGEEVRPYAEVVKKEGGQIHLIAIFLVNDQNVIEFYCDGENTNTPATGKLKKYVPPKEDKVTKVPRVK